MMMQSAIEKAPFTPFQWLEAEEAVSDAHNPDSFEGRGTGGDQSDGSFVLTRPLATYYRHLLSRALRADEGFKRDVTTLVATTVQLDRAYSQIEVHIKHALDARLGRAYASEQGLLDELFRLLVQLKSMARGLLLN
jgi:hypothetical protein